MRQAYGLAMRDRTRHVGRFGRPRHPFQRAGSLRRRWDSLPQQQSCAPSAPPPSANSRQHQPRRQRLRLPGPEVGRGRQVGPQIGWGWGPRTGRPENFARALRGAGDRALIQGLGAIWTGLDWRPPAVLPFRAVAIEELSEQHVSDARRLQEKVRAVRTAEQRLGTIYESGEETVEAAREYLVARANLDEAAGSVDVGRDAGS